MDVPKKRGVAESDGLTLAECAEAFAAGFSETRSLTYPFPATRVAANAWVLADAPPPGGKARRHARRPEIITWDTSPEAATEAARRAALGSRYFLCLLVQGDEEAETLATFKGAGCRLQRREPLFVAVVAHRTGGADYPVRRVTDAADAERVAAAARARQVVPEHLGAGAETADVRLYAAFDDATGGGAAAGWVRSVRTRPDRSWVSNLFVRPEYRGRGIGRSLMRRMLDGDAEAGVRHSVLLASQAGSRLYPHLGYERRGTCLVLLPKA